MRAPAALRAAGRLAAVAATAAVLLATSRDPCVEEDRGTFDAVTSCGPDAAVTLSFSGARFGGSGCSREDCWAEVEASGAGAAGLPERGEIHPDPGPHDPNFDASTTPPGTAFVTFPFALVGDAPVAGASPPATVRRTCRATPSATAGVVDVACTGATPAAACGGTLTLRVTP